MDPRILLDYALFQLTPTRTRCDLIIFSGGNKEKLASGLVEPFISHLKFAKDQIPKGGYSIQLNPPSPHSPWFTKSTFQRVVRFISSPEILERFLRIELEISQIESSVAEDGITNKSPDSSKTKGENGGAKDGTQEESSKIKLQRHLETRKALLRKEQAMAYARAFVAGFEMDNMNDLILFSDAFGALRLRQACTDFMELCKKKHTDGLWMDELAAMAACSPADFAYTGTSGIVLTPETNSTVLPNGSLERLTASQVNSEENKDNPSTPAKAFQMPWMNQIPQYMYNFQNQGYPYPNMQPMPQYYQGPMNWPQNVDSSTPRTRKSSSRKKDKKVESSEEEEELQSTESEDDDVSDEVKSSVTKKHRKKSSKTVVIRNINYITSKNGASDESSQVDDDFLDEVESLSRNHKPKSRSNKKKEVDRVDDNEGWSALQNLLTRDENHQEKNLDDEHFAIQNNENRASYDETREIMSDSFGVNGDNYRPVTKRDSTDVDLMMSNRSTQEPHNNGRRISSDSVQESSVIRTSKSEDWFAANRSEQSQDKKYYNDDYTLEGNNQFQKDNSRKIEPIDDSFMVQSFESAHDNNDSQWKTVISMVENFEEEKTQVKNGPIQEPEDPCVVLVRDSGPGLTESGWGTELDYGVEVIPFTKSDKKSPPVETREAVIEEKIKTPVKNTKIKKVEAKPKELRNSISSRNKLEALAKSKKALSKPMVQKSKFEQEEEIRKRMEEVAIERQKRIAERTAASKSKAGPTNSAKVGPTKSAKGPAGLVGQKKQGKI